MDLTHADILIVGAGHGGAQAAVSLRMQGFEGSLVIIGDEPDLPYDRPALSKDYLAGEKMFERMLIRPEAFWKDRQVVMLTGRRVTAVDPIGKVVTAGDRQIGYGQLIWAAGGTPRRLNCEGSDLAGIFTVRTRADADAMVAVMPQIEDVLVIGGGYIGLEAAAVFSKHGKMVTLLESLPRVLARVAGEPLSRFYEAEHRAHGVDVRLDAALKSFVGSDGRVTGALMADGECISAQLIVVGIGIAPNIEPLIAAGAEGANGVHVDRFCRTSLPDVFAIGDCAAHENGFARDLRIRLESVQNANDQATTVAKFIMGDHEPYQATPWFWSNQYDLKLQTVGLSSDHDDHLIRGDPGQRSFSVIYLRDGQVIALDCVNAAKDYVQGRKLVEAGASPTKRQLADGSIGLKELLA